jgi:hypothetical protein
LVRNNHSVEIKELFLCRAGTRVLMGPISAPDMPGAQQKNVGILYNNGSIVLRVMVFLFHQQLNRLIGHG